MDIQISVLSVLLAALSAMVVGTLWYSPMLFGKQWSKATGVSEKSMSKSRPKAVPQLIIAALLTAYILAHVTYLSQQFFHYSYFKSAVTTAFWVWLGASATTLVSHEAFEERPKNLLWINIGNRFATYMVMGLIIGWIGL